MGRFLKIDTAVNRLTYWVGAYTLMSAAFAWIAAKIQALHIGWPEAVFIGIFAAGFVTLAVSAGLVAWRFFRPLAAFYQVDNEPNPEPRTDLATHADLHRHDKALAELTDRITAVRGMVEASHEGTKTRLDEIAKGCFDLEQKINDWTRQHLEDEDRRFDNIDDGFGAILNREWHERLFRELGVEYDRLADQATSRHSGVRGEQLTGARKARHYGSW